MAAKFFGEFLLDKGLFDRETLDRAVLYNKVLI